MKLESSNLQNQLNTIFCYAKQVIALSLTTSSTRLPAISPIIGTFVRLLDFLASFAVINVRAVVSGYYFEATINST